MGWGRWFLLGDLGQQLDLHGQQVEIDRLRQEMQGRRQVAARQSATRFEELQRENDELKLYVAALMRLIVAKGVANAEEIRALVRTVDGEDGVSDGRLAGPVIPRG